MNQLSVPCGVKGRYLSIKNTNLVKIYNLKEPYPVFIAARAGEK